MPKRPSDIAPPKRDKTGKQDPDAEQSSTEIVELSAFRAQLSRGRRTRRADALLNDPHPAEAIARLPEDEFYYVVHEMGFPDAMEILVHGTPEQVQTCLDFSIWNRDELDPVAAEEWLAHLLEAPYKTFGRWASGVDVELLALLLRKRSRIYDVAQDEESPSENSDNEFYDTPD